MAGGSFPGHDAAGYKDPTAFKLQTFADSTARDAWVTAQGGTTQIPAGFTCFLTGTNAVNIWNGSAWRSIATT